MEGVSCVSTREQDLFGHEDGRQIRPSPDRHPVLLLQVEMPSRSGAGHDTEAR